MKHNKIIILGSGPAGYTSAIYTARANLNPVLITGTELGGQLINTPEIENWPGNPDNLSGSILMKRMYSHAIKFNTKIIFDHIHKVNLLEKPFVLYGSNNKYTCFSLIIATGSSPNNLNIPNEKIYLGKGVSYCATCDGYFYKNKKVAVIGGGNTAVEETLYLSKIAKEVHLIHRRNELKAEKILIDRLKNKINIFIHKNTVLEQILGDTNVNCIYLKNLINNKLRNINIDGIFIAIGFHPNTSIFKNQLNMKNNYICVNLKKNGNITATSIPGVFAAGDVIDSNYRQAITSAGSGCMAAIDVERFLEKQNLIN